MSYFVVVNLAVIIGSALGGLALLALILLLIVYKVKKSKKIKPDTLTPGDKNL